MLEEASSHRSMDRCSIACLTMLGSSVICGSPWEEKVNTAFFRGTATGGGTKIENNQRLKLANLHHVWYV